MEAAVIEPYPKISVIISTKDRPELVVKAVASVLSQERLDIELIVVDQSIDSQTENDLTTFLPDIRFKYFHTPGTGLSKSRNLGISHAKASLIAITDDDCVVFPDWISQIVAIFDQNKKIGLIFGQVIAAAYNKTEGFIPEYKFDNYKLCKRPINKMRLRGMGACISLRKSLWSQLEGFDEVLGVGAPFKACEDWDLAFRALLNGWYVVEVPTIKVSHFGFRTFEDGKKLTERNYYGIGALYTKYLRCGQAIAILFILYEFFWLGLFTSLGRLILRRPPYGYRKLPSFISGIKDSLTYKIDTEQYKYCLKISKE